MKAKWSIFGICFVLLALVGIFALGTGQPASAQEDIETCLQYPQLNPLRPVRVKEWPPLANYVRDAPGFEGSIIGRIQPGTHISLRPEGMPPRCADGIYWWYVEWAGGIGWTAEGNGSNQYWLENFDLPGTPTVPPVMPTSTPVMPTVIPPGTVTPTPVYPPVTPTYFPPTVTPVYPPGTATSTPVLPTVAPPSFTPTPLPAHCTLAPRLSLLERGRVLPGPANLIRVSPVDLSPEAVIGRIPGGGVFTVVAGPYCGQDGRLWWYVIYQGIEGWTAEGENGTYWLEPLG